MPEGLQKSNATGRLYSPIACVFIFNMAQATKYIKHGAPIIDIFISNGDLCFVFTRKDTQELYRLWCEYKLD